MKRELAIHFSFWLVYFLLLSLLKQYFDLSYWAFWIGGLIGVFLPDIDHVIYIYFSKPHELTSQRIGYLVEKKDFWRILSLIYETRSERKNLIFHSILFQLILLLLTFFVFSTSDSLIARGLTLSFCLHLLVDQAIDLRSLKSLDNWMNLLPFDLDFQRAKIHIGILFFLVCMLSVLM